MKIKVCRKGIALFMVLITAMIVFILSVTIAGITTQEGRNSLRRSHEIITRQTALAGIKYAQNLLYDDWNNPKLAKVIIFNDEYYPENGCYYSVSVKLHTSDQCIFTSEAYFKETLTETKKLWARGVEATFVRSAYNFALQGIGNAVWVPHTLSSGYTYYTYETPQSLNIVGAEIDGKIATKQKFGEINVQPIPHIEGSGDDAHEVPVILSVESDSHLIMNDISSSVTVKKEGNSIQEPVQYPEPRFPYNASKTDYDTTQDTENHPGHYASLSASTSSNVTVGGGGCYSIRNCSISTSGQGNVAFNAGTYYIDDLNVSGGGSLTLSSGNYFIKRMNLNGGSGLFSGGQLDIKVNIVNKKPVNIIVSESAMLENVNLNPGSQNLFADPSNLIINGTIGCVQNTLTNCSGAFVFQNKGNIIDVINTRNTTNLKIDGSIVGNGLNVTGNGFFSCHKEKIQTNQIILTKWEEI
ncbi:MAG: hypothetical protein AB9903_00105 [Vulcanimicrobiota bacterium]